MTGINLAMIRDPEARRLLGELNATLRDMADKIEAALKGPPPVEAIGPWDGFESPKIEPCDCGQENCTCESNPRP